MDSLWSDEKALEIMVLFVVQQCNAMNTAAAAKSHQSCPTLYDPTDGNQAPPSLGFSRQEFWSGLPFLPLMHESEK